MIHRKHLSKILYAASAALVLAACADQTTAPSSLPTTESRPPAAGAVKFKEAGSSVTWNGIARDFLQARTFNPFFEARALTYLSLAQYNAIIAAEDSKTRRTHPSPAGAAAGASVVVLKDFFSLTPAELAVIEATITAQRSGEQQTGQWKGEQNGSFAAGEAIGTGVGHAVVAYAHSDNTGLLPLPTQLTGSGYWTGTPPPVRGLFGTRPLALLSADQFRPHRPPTFGSRAFRRALAEVQSLSAPPIEAHVAQAVFWNTRVARYQNEIAAGMIVSHKRNERDAAHILALANIAAFDALIGCWDAKFTYWYIRPSQVPGQAITITLSIGLPNHPSYPSGHSCATAAYSTVLGQAFPDERPGLAANIEAAGLSRMYAGIHYRFDIEAGQMLGRQVAEYVLSTDVTGHEAIPLD